MRLTFKEVGQGDTILLEWTDDSQKKIAIIDSNIKENGTNPALNYVKGSSYTSIEFILLSHPHYDHFSGLNELISFCEAKKIEIKKFFHTSLSTPEFLQSAVRGNVAKRDLAKLFQNIQRLYRSGLIGDVFVFMDGSSEIVLNNEWKIKCLSPSNRELSDYNSRAYKNIEVKINNSDANLLSTFLQIYSKQNSIFLTSDLTSHTFKRLIKKISLTSINVVLGQLSHHGAKANYHSTFWKLPQRVAGVPSIISVGKNDYGHPSPEVLTDNSHLGYQPYLTNAISTSATANSTSLALDAVSTLVGSNSAIVSRDICFDVHTCNIL